MHRAVFLDRDGTVNKAIPVGAGFRSPRTLDEFEIDPDAARTFETLRRAGLLLFLVTNQPEVGRGLISRDVLDAMHALLRRKIRLDDIFICFHDDADACECRKPKPGMLLQAARKYSIDLGHSTIVGDTWKDMEAGKGAGCRTILLSRPWNRGVEADHTVQTLDEIVPLILESSGLRLP